ncbi:hypothetical protein ACYOEI_11665 [Singulisphaera rosea]
MILVDGKVVVSLKINNTIKDRAVVSGLSEEHTKQIVAIVKSWD